jgi:hypothetical protein
VHVLAHGVPGVGLVLKIPRKDFVDWGDVVAGM